MLIRLARPGDIPTLVRFNQALARETEGKRLDVGRLKRGVTGLFDRPERGRYFVAEAEGAVIGQMMITYEWSDWRNADFWWIQSVYVPAAQRRRGVFRALFQHVSRAAREGKASCGLRLYVERNNRRAKSVYRAMGMALADYTMMELAYVTLRGASPRRAQVG